MATNLDKSIPSSNVDPLHFLPEPIINSFFVNPATPAEINCIIMSLEDKSCALDVVPVFVYKKFSHCLSPIICDIFNSSITEGVFPDIFKIARISPIYKSSDVKCICNFRPISLLSTVSKIIEKLMKVRANSFIDSNDILYKKQFGFRPGYSTADAVVEFVDQCASALDNKMYFIAIFLDLSKAFDTVNKNILLGKLNRMGFRGKTEEWFRSYLSDRKMYVNLNNSNSRTATINIGVPQGSVSAPWLFSLYVNDMHRCSYNLSFIHFADDTTIFKSGTDLAQLCRDINDEMRNVSRWLVANRLSLNVEKTKFMLFTHSHVDLNDVHIVINNKEIALVDNIKFLGINIDSRLSFHHHINLLSKKLSCVVGVIRKISTVVPDYILKVLYYSLFYPHLIYGVQVWGGCGVTDRRRITRLHDRAIKMCFDQNVNIPLKFHLTYQYFILSMFYKCVSSDHNVHFLTKIRNLAPNHSHSTRFSNNFKYNIPYLHKTVSQHQFFYNAIVAWNSLPVNLKDIDSYCKFRKELRKYLFALN